MGNLHRHTFYEVYLTRDREISAESASIPISSDEWLKFVASDPDLARVEQAKFSNGQTSEQEAWAINSHSEGTPIFYDSGRIYIREDDATTIEKLVEIAGKLQANVLGEDGTEYFDAAGESRPAVTPIKSTPNVSSGTPSGQVPLYDEIVRKRQCLVLMLACTAIPIYIAWEKYNGENPGELFLWGLGSIALFVYAAVLYFKPKYYLQLQDSDSVLVYQLDPKSSKDELICKEMKRSEIEPLELVWFPLEYPSKTKIEFHVRSQKHPWLVLYACGNKEKSQSKLNSLSRQLFVSAVDNSGASAATNIPKKYQLTDEEKGKKKKRSNARS